MTEPQTQVRTTITSNNHSHILITHRYVRNTLILPACLPAGKGPGVSLSGCSTCSLTNLSLPSTSPNKQNPKKTHKTHAPPNAIHFSSHQSHPNPNPKASKKTTSPISNPASGEGEQGPSSHSRSLKIPDLPKSPLFFSLLPLGIDQRWESKEKVRYPKVPQGRRKEGVKEKKGIAK